MGSFSLCPVLGQKDQQEMKIPILRMSIAASISKMPAAFECLHLSKLCKQPLIGN